MSASQVLNAPTYLPDDFGSKWRFTRP